jgi:adenylate kinase
MPKHIPINIILLGDPAAGKATQAALLLKKYHLFDFDMGQELRKLRRRNASLDKALSRTTDHGKLTPTQFVRQIDHDRIIGTPASKGILFDGHPKMLQEARLVAKLLKQQRRLDPLVLYVSIPIEETIKRMCDRKHYFQGKFSTRADDTVVALKNRVKYYRHNIAQVVAFFESKYQFKKINGLGTVAQVHRRIQAAMDEFLKTHAQVR